MKGGTYGVYLMRNTIKVSRIRWSGMAVTGGRAA